MTIYVGFTTGGGPPTWSLFFSTLGLRMPDNQPWRYIQGDPSATDWSRNDLVWQFLDNDDAEWLLQVDRDAILHPDTLKRLLSWDRKAIAALAFMRGVPPLPTIWSWERNSRGTRRIAAEETAEWIIEHEIQTHREFLVEPRPDDALVRVPQTGAHCLLCHRSVFEAVEPPWFEFFEDRHYGNSGEDANFCKKLREADIPLYVDRSVVAGHSAGERSIGALDFVAYSSIMRERK